MKYLKYHTIYVSKEVFQQMLDAVKNPPKPTDGLIKALKKTKIKNNG